MIDKFLKHVTKSLFSHEPWWKEFKNLKNNDPILKLMPTDSKNKDYWYSVPGQLTFAFTNKKLKKFHYINHQDILKYEKESRMLNNAGSVSMCGNGSEFPGKLLFQDFTSIGKSVRIYSNIYENLFVPVKHDPNLKNIWIMRDHPQVSIPVIPNEFDEDMIEDLEEYIAESSDNDFTRPRLSEIMEVYESENVNGIISKFQDNDYKWHKNVRKAKVTKILTLQEREQITSFRIRKNLNENSDIYVIQNEYPVLNIVGNIKIYNLTCFYSRFILNCTNIPDDIYLVPHDKLKLFISPGGVPKGCLLTICYNCGEELLLQGLGFQEISRNNLLDIPYDDFEGNWYYLEGSKHPIKSKTDINFRRAETEVKMDIGKSQEKKEEDHKGKEGNEDGLADLNQTEEQNANVYAKYFKFLGILKSQQMTKNIILTEEQKKTLIGVVEMINAGIAENIDHDPVIRNTGLNFDRVCLNIENNNYLTIDLLTLLLNKNTPESETQKLLLYQLTTKLSLALGQIQEKIEFEFEMPIDKMRNKLFKSIDQEKYSPLDKNSDLYKELFIMFREETDLILNRGLIMDKDSQRIAKVVVKGLISVVKDNKNPDTLKNSSKLKHLAFLTYLQQVIKGAQIQDNLAGRKIGARLNSMLNILSIEFSKKYDDEDLIDDLEYSVDQQTGSFLTSLLTIT